MKYIYKNIDEILVVDENLKEDIIKNAKIDGENISYLPTGHDRSYWKLKEKKENIVLTVAGANNIKRAKLKGLDTFVRAAAEFKNIKFIIIGAEKEARFFLENEKSENVTVLGFLNQDEILNYYQKSKVFCLLSYREGLPTVMCEAMLCECIPVGTHVQGIKSAMGDVGFYCDFKDVKSTVEAIKKGLKAPDYIGKRARERIITMYPKEKREKGLIQIIKGLV